MLLAIWLNDSSAFQHQIQQSPIITRFREGVPRTTSMHAIVEEEEEANTTFTLSFGDVEFCLTPDTTNVAATDVKHIQNFQW